MYERLNKETLFRVGKRGSWRCLPRRFCLILGTFFFQVNMKLQVLLVCLLKLTSVKLTRLRKFLCVTSADCVCVCVCVTNI